MLTRDEALAIFQAQSPDKALFSHCLASEAVMERLADHFGEDKTLWGISGLLHDVDFPHTRETPDKHGVMAMDILENKLPPEALHAIQAHNGEYTGVAAESRLDFALRAAESVTGLVSANALVRPEGMNGMKPKSLKKKMKEKAFAANVDRERIKDCEKIDLDLGTFFGLAIEAMAARAEELGLVK